MKKFLNNLYFKGLAAKNKVCEMMVKENGEANIVAIILVIAIVVALAIIFRTKITALFNTIWNAIVGKTDSVIN